MKSETCPDCGSQYSFGSWPFCPDHGKPYGMEFKPYIDYHMLEKPVEITSWAQKQRLLRIHKLIERDPPSNNWMSERRDRCEAIREERGRMR